MGRRGPTPSTYEAFLEYAKTQRCEWIDGVIYDMSGASINHGIVIRELGNALYNHLKGKPCELFYENIEVRLHETHPKGTVEPDLKVVCEPNQIQGNAIVGPPTLIVEVLSSSTSSRDHVTKRHLYERHGVPEYWIVSPDERSITVCTLVDGAYEDELLEKGIARSTALPGFEIDLATLFEGLRSEG